jgi:fructose-bisphosphate aldolase class II
VTNSPTLIVSYGGPFGENYWYTHENVHGDAKLRRFTPEAELDAKTRRRGTNSGGSPGPGGWFMDEEYAFPLHAQFAKKVVEAAHPCNVSVEAELGTIGTMEGNQIIYTDPADAKRFVEETGVDTLAIAIGTRHGLYPKGLIPKVELELLKEIRKAVSIPLVLHGGSNNPDDEIEQACLTGVSKLNISSDIKSAFYKKCREVLQDQSLLEPNVIFPPCIEEMKKVMRQKMDLFHTTGKAEVYGRKTVKAANNTNSKVL